MIGIFDSGAGGLSVWKELISTMPDESYYYISDAAYCPYGNRDKSEIAERAVKISKYLIDKGVDIIVVACNTATAAAIELLRKSFDIPFVGMEPAVKPAASFSQSGVIGVLATKGTLKGDLYLNTSKEFAEKKDVKVIEQVGEGLVEIVESGEFDTPHSVELIKKYIDPMIGMGADSIVLGCTHYPFLKDLIVKLYGENIKILNPAPAVARQTKKLLGAIRKVSETSVDEQNTTSFQTIATTGTDTKTLKKLASMIIEELETKKILSPTQLLPYKEQTYLRLENII